MEKVQWFRESRWRTHVTQAARCVLARGSPVHGPARQPGSALPVLTGIRGAAGRLIPGIASFGAT